MSVDNLTAAIDKERASRSAWSEMPLYYVEVVRALIAHAREDFGAAADVVEEKLGELLGIRWSKVETGAAPRKLPAAGVVRTTPLAWRC